MSSTDPREQTLYRELRARLSTLVVDERPAVVDGATFAMLLAEAGDWPGCVRELHATAWLVPPDRRRSWQALAGGLLERSRADPTGR